VGGKEGQKTWSSPATVLVFLVKRGRGRKRGKKKGGKVASPQPSPQVTSPNILHFFYSEEEGEGEEKETGDQDAKMCEQFVPVPAVLIFRKGGGGGEQDIPKRHEPLPPPPEKKKGERRGKKGKGGRITATA